MTEGDPDWNLLPHEPVRFFGLAEGFSRTDLKRSYTQLIKRFRPETFPQEFQRIRGAYEQLDHQLRYGSTIDGMVRTTDLRATPTTANPAPDLPARVTRRVESPKIPEQSPPQIDLRKTPNEAYRVLVELTNKGPQHYYELALLSDVVADNGGRAFLHWIVQGLQRHPRDMGLLRLVHAFVESGLVGSYEEATLVSICEALRTETFFAITESLWRELLDRLPFEKFAALLQRCETMIRDVQVHVRVVFYLQLLRPALFKASDEWLEQVSRFIAEHQQYLPHYLDMDLEVTWSLLKYRVSGATLAREQTVRTYIHQAMVTYCEESELEGNRAVVDVQLAATKARDHFYDAFPMDGIDLSVALTAWEWVCVDVRQRLMMPQQIAPRERYGEAAAHAIRSLHSEYNDRVQAMRGGGYLHISGLIFCLFFGTLVGLVLGLAVHQDSSGLELVWAFSVPIVFVALYWFTLGEYIRHKRRIKQARQLNVFYAEQWRPRLFQAAFDLCGDWEFLRNMAHQYASNNSYNDCQVFHELDNRLPHDYGLGFFATTAQFVS